MVEHLPFTEICVAIYNEHGKDILGLYRLTNLELLKMVFLDAATRDRYLKDGLQILDIRLSGYNNAETRNFMTITLNSIPIMYANTLTTLITNAISNIVPSDAKFHSCRPLIVPDTEFLTNQWQAHYDVTECGYEIFDNFQKFIEIDGFKVNLY